MESSQAQFDLYRVTSASSQPVRIAFSVSNSGAMVIPDFLFEDRNLMVVCENEVWVIYRQNPQKNKPIKSFKYKKLAVKYAIKLAAREGISVTIYPKPYEPPTVGDSGN